ncbi:MAG: molecular chaperone HtpG, partial [Kiritimatiellae bacterium]|nr:molecular chaperone HtpG [Kiritimatiellia bacterium]
NKILSELTDLMKNDRAAYETFYAAFGRVLKEGLYSDWENADKIKALLLFPSAKSDGAKTISLTEYVAEMPKEQTDIYYLISEDLDTARQSPHLEAVRKRGYDVLLFVDAIDQWIVDNLREFDGKKLIPIDKGNLELGTEKEKAEEKKKLDTATVDYKPLLDFIQEHLKEDIKEVRLSPRLTDSACVLVADENAMSASMERMMRAMHQEVPKQMRILELNPDHALVQRMKAMFEADKTDTKLTDFTDLLYGEALLSEGSQLKDAKRFTKLVTELMIGGAAQ